MSGFSRTEGVVSGFSRTEDVVSGFSRADKVRLKADTTYCSRAHQGCFGSGTTVSSTRRLAGRNALAAALMLDGRSAR